MNIWDLMFTDALLTFLLTNQIILIVTLLLKQSMDFYLKYK